MIGCISAYPENFKVVRDMEKMVEQRVLNYRVWFYVYEVIRENIQV